MSENTEDKHDELDDIDFDVNSHDLSALPLHSDEHLTDPERGYHENVLYYNNKKYAAGLLWLASSDIEDTQTIKDKAKLCGADFYCTRLFVQQTGYGFLKKGHRWGMPSIAAIAADALVGEWHGVFRAEDRWLYVAVHADNIAPEGDKIFMTEEEAYNHFLVESEKFKWPKAYAPSNWKLKNNDGEIHIEQVLEGMEPAILKHANSDAVFSGKANKTLAIIAGVILFILLTLLMFSKSFVNFIVPPRIDDPVRDFEINALVALPPEEPEPLADPVQNLLQTTQLIAPMQFIKACMENFDVLMVSLPGWDIDRMRCRGNVVDALWQGRIGSLDDLRNYIDQFPFRVNKTYGSSGNFLASTTISSYSELSTSLELSERQNALLLLNQRFSGLGALSVADIAPSTDYYARMTQTQEITRPLNLQDVPSLKAVLRTNVSPIKIKENFNIPGLKLNVVEWNLAQNGWFYDMQIYLYPENYKIPEN